MKFLVILSVFLSVQMVSAQTSNVGGIALPNTASVAAKATAVDQAKVKEIVDRLVSLNAMREGLAKTLDGKKDPITEDTFKKVCMPVGKALKEWGESKGYKVRQITEKYRNLNHVPKGEEFPILEQFAKDKNKIHSAELSENKWGTGTQIYVRIPVIASCLHCHGERDKRPEFIKVKYPDDLAFDYKAGDLRGLYSVFIIDKK